VFNVHGSVHRNNILVYKSQEDAQITEFILSDNCSTCFGRHSHPSSGATASGNGYTVIDGVKFLLLQSADRPRVIDMFYLRSVTPITRHDYFPKVHNTMVLVKDRCYSLRYTNRVLTYYLHTTRASERLKVFPLFGRFKVKISLTFPSGMKFSSSSSPNPLT
jgi:hypothetical protein